VQRQSGEKPRVTGPGPDEPYAARFKLRQTEKGAVDHSETASGRDAVPAREQCWRWGCQLARSPHARR
jgi:hypothetical protein